MEKFPDDFQVAANANEPGPLLLDQFQSEWQEAIDRISPPDMASFLDRAGERHVSELAELLQAVDSEYRNRLGRESAARPEGNDTETAACEKTVLGPLNASDDVSLMEEDDEIDFRDTPVAGAFANTAEWIPEQEPPGEEPAVANPDEAFAATILGDTARANGDPTNITIKQAKPGLPASRHVAGYEILDTLGRGGMGVVYLARQGGLNRLVALKMILGGGHAAPEFLARFRAEAEAVAQLQHPNIVQIHEIGVHEGLPYFSLELVDGQSLEAEQAGRPLSPLRAAELVEILARAMHYAHGRGIVHRDLKPANVLLTRDGMPKVTDFGLVKRLEEEDSGQTRTGTIMGTPSYMAPEQAWGSKAVGPLADVYSLGAVLYALLTGRPAFLGPTAAETVLQLRHQEPVPPSRLQPNLPRDLETICLKCLQKDQDKRYASAEELAEDLRRFQAGEPILARPVGRAERLWRWCRRNPALATSGGIAMALALCLMIGGPLSAFLVNQERETAIENKELAIQNAGFARQQRDHAVIALELLVERVPTELKNVPGTEKIKRSLLLTAMDGLNKVGDVEGKESKDFVMAKAHAKMGEVLLEIGETQSAQEQFSLSHAILLKLPKTETGTAEHTHQLRLGRSFRNLGKAAERMEGAQAACQLYRNSLKAREAALPLAPDPLWVKQEIAECYGNLGRMSLDLGRPHEAMDYFTKSIAYRDEWVDQSPGNEEALREQAGAQSSLGHAHLNLGDPVKAAEQFQKALIVLSTLSKKDNSDSTDKTNAALCYNDLGTAFLFSGNLSAARENFKEAVGRLEPLFRANNRSTFLLRKLAKSYYCLGTVCQELNDPEAAKHLERSVFARRQLFEKISKDRESRQNLMLSLARNGQMTEALSHAEQVTKDASQNADALYQVACTYALCAAARERTTNNSETQPSIPSAEEFRQKAVAVLREAVKQGYQATAMLQLDPDLAAVREEADFGKLQSELEQRDKIADNKPK